MLVFIACLVSGTIACLFARNLQLFGQATQEVDDALPPVSVLIPARDEGLGIRATMEAVLANEDVILELLVLDDDSRDDTASIVSEIAREDARVRLVRGQPLPAGWCGKQFACQQLASEATYEHLLFIDADVKLAPNALKRCLAQFQTTNAHLLSGFPRQVVGSFGESLLIPLIHVVLLCYLPFDLMRRTRMSGAAAGCGQLFLTTHVAYWQVGGHGTIHSSLHDGITLPRAFRAAGLRSDLFDASDIASCRMYHGWSETWNGLLKNAHEGMAAPRTIVPATLLLAMAAVLPPAVAIQQTWGQATTLTVALAYVAATLAFLPRLVCALRFDRCWLSALLFPLSCMLFIGLQWCALIRRAFGVSSHWRNRSYSLEMESPYSGRTAA